MATVNGRSRISAALPAVGCVFDYAPDRQIQKLIDDRRMHRHRINAINGIALVLTAPNSFDERKEDRAGAWLIGLVGFAGIDHQTAAIQNFLSDLGRSRYLPWGRGGFFRDPVVHDRLSVKDQRIVFHFDFSDSLFRCVGPILIRHRWTAGTSLNRLPRQRHILIDRIDNMSLMGGVVRNRDPRRGVAIRLQGNLSARQCVVGNLCFLQAVYLQTVNEPVAVLALHGIAFRYGLRIRA